MHSAALLTLCCVLLSVHSWVAAHLLSNHFPDEAVELLVAAVFLEGGPLGAPGSAPAGEGKGSGLGEQFGKISRFHVLWGSQYKGLTFRLHILGSGQYKASRSCAYTAVLYTACSSWGPACSPSLPPPTVDCPDSFLCPSVHMTSCPPFIFTLCAVPFMYRLATHATPAVPAPLVSTPPPAGPRQQPGLKRTQTGRWWPGRGRYCDLLV